VIAQTGIQQVSPWRSVRENWIHMAKQDPRLPLTRAVYSATANLRGEVFFDRTSGLAALQGRDVDVETSALCFYRPRGLWHPDVLAAELRTGRWDYVLVLHPNAAIPAAFANDPILDAAFSCRLSVRPQLPTRLRGNNIHQSGGATVSATGQELVLSRRSLRGAQN